MDLVVCDSNKLGTRFQVRDIFSKKIFYIFVFKALKLSTKYC